MNHSERTEVWNEAKKQDVAQRKLARKRHRAEQSGVPVQVLDDQRIQNEADRIASTLQNLTAHNSPRKTHFIVRVAEDVTAQAGPGEMARLLAAVQSRVPGNLFFDTLPGMAGVYCFRSPDDCRNQEVRKCLLCQYPRI